MAPELLPLLAMPPVSGEGSGGGYGFDALSDFSGSNDDDGAGIVAALRMFVCGCMICLVEWQVMMVGCRVVSVV
jgi:hypothetical protein